MRNGDTVYFCDEGQCFEVIFIGQADDGCKVIWNGNPSLVECDKLQVTCDGIEVHEADFSEGQRVTVRMQMSGDIIRTWPGTIKKIHANGKIAIALDDLGRINVAKENIIALATK